MSSEFPHNKWSEHNKWSDPKKYPHNGWYPEPTITDLYSAINGLKKQVEVLVEQNRDTLNLLMEIVGGEEENEEIGIVEVVLVENGYDIAEEESGCGENCKCKPQFPLGGETPLDDVCIWLEQQIDIWGRNDETRAVGYQHTLEHIKRLQKYIGE